MTRLLAAVGWVHVAPLRRVALLQRADGAGGREELHRDPPRARRLGRLRGLPGAWRRARAAHPPPRPPSARSASLSARSASPAPTLRAQIEDVAPPRLSLPTRARVCLSTAPPPPSALTRRRASRRRMAAPAAAAALAGAHGGRPRRRRQAARAGARRADVLKLFLEQQSARVRRPAVLRGASSSSSERGGRGEGRGPPRAAAATAALIAQRSTATATQTAHGWVDAPTRARRAPHSRDPLIGGAGAAVCVVAVLCLARRTRMSSARAQFHRIKSFTLTSTRRSSRLDSTLEHGRGDSDSFDSKEIRARRLRRAALSPVRTPAYCRGSTLLLRRGISLLCITHGWSRMNKGGCSAQPRDDDGSHMLLWCRPAEHQHTNPQVENRANSRKQ